VYLCVGFLQSPSREPLQATVKNVNRFAALLMSFLILLTSLRELTTYVIFRLNQDYISRNLCKNRFKPELMCYGKCVLSNSLAEQHKQEKDKKSIPQQEEPSVFVLPNVEIIIKPHFFLNLKKDSISYYSVNFYAFECLDDVFRPPPIFS
jgi:hypothetical protein